MPTKKGKPVAKKPVAKKKKKKPYKRTRKPTRRPKTDNNPNGAGRYFFDAKDAQEERNVIAKLEQVFSIGGSDAEACIQAGISLDSLYRYCRKYPEFRNRKELLKEKMVLAARTTINLVVNEREISPTGQMTNVPTSRSAEMSKWYLERKKKVEFAPQFNGILEDGRSGVLTEERKKAIAETAVAWSDHNYADEQREDYENKLDF